MPQLHPAILPILTLIAQALQQQGRKGALSRGKKAKRKKVTRYDSGGSVALSGSSQFGPDVSEANPSLAALVPPSALVSPAGSSADLGILSIPGSSILPEAWQSRPLTDFRPTQAFAPDQYGTVSGGYD